MPEDFTTLNNPRFLYLAELHHPFPDWVAQAPIPEKQDFEKKAASAFADPKRRLLPIATKEAAFHSAINLFAHLADYDAEVFERVKEACAFFGIEQDIAPYADLFAGEHEKSASADVPAEGRYAISDEINGERFQLLPLNDSDDVIQSAFDLAKMASENRIHFLMLVPAAREIVKAARDHGITKLPLMVQRFGCEYFADADTAGQLLKGREQMAKEAADREAIGRFYQEALDAWKRGEDTPETCMEKIAAIDDQAGIEASLRITSQVPTPFDIVFNGGLVSEAEKAAAANVCVKDILVPLHEVKRIHALEAEYKLSKSAAEQFSKLRDTDDAKDLSLAIGTWDDNDQRTFLRLSLEAAIN